MHLENLKNGDVYRLRIAAYNAAGNGVPSDGAEIHMKERGNVVNCLLCYTCLKMINKNLLRK